MRLDRGFRCWFSFHHNFVIDLWRLLMHHNANEQTISPHLRLTSQRVRLSSIASPRTDAKQTDTRLCYMGAVGMLQLQPDYHKQINEQASHRSADLPPQPSTSDHNRIGAVSHYRHQSLYFRFCFRAFHSSWWRVNHNRPLRMRRLKL